MSLFGRKKEDKKEEKPAAKTVALKADKKEEEKKSMKELYEESSVVPVSSKKGGKAEEVEKKSKFSRAYRILLKPMVTEKATNLGVLNKYVFAVSPKANKIEIAQAIEAVYGVKPVGVNIMRAEGKTVRSGRTFGRRKDWKKAIVALPAGKTIKVYEGV
ncbi:MAG: 50S ribosomal protein L23 [Patescibacteria group bacterium]